MSAVSEHVLPGQGMSQAEDKFFESGGAEVAPELESGITRTEPAETTAPAPAQAEVPDADGAVVRKGGQEERFVPLQALQEERAEKKQLREEIKQFREWQQQLTQRLQQMPQQAQEQVPDPNADPIGYINHVLGNVQKTTGELQQWRQAQEQETTSQARTQQTLNWASQQARSFEATQPEYPSAYKFASEARDKEYQSMGITDPGMRQQLIEQDTARVINHAAQNGLNPAELIFNFARVRGFTPKGQAITGNTEAQAKIAAGLQAGGSKLNQGGSGGDGDLSAKDLAGITDPEEFEKAWGKIFGKKR